jgi:hypothetical protein
MPSEAPLEGWEAIGAHLGIKGRGALRVWKDKGLPVRFTGTGRTPVAGPADLDRWLLKAPADWRAGLWASPYRPGHLWLLVLLLAVLAGTAPYLLPSLGSREPATFRLDGDRLTVSDRLGRSIWKYRFESDFSAGDVPPSRPGNAPEGGRSDIWIGQFSREPEIETVFRYAPGGRAAALCFFSRRGELVQRYEPGKTTGRESTSAVDYEVAADPRGLSSRAYVLASGFRDDPRLLATLGKAGLISAFIFTGSAKSLRLPAGEPGGRPDVFILTESPPRVALAFFVLDQAVLDTQGGRFQQGKGDPATKARVELPDFCSEAVGAVHHLKKLVYVPDGLRIVIALHDDSPATLTWELDHDFRLRSVGLSPELRAKHDLVLGHTSEACLKKLRNNYKVIRRP